MAISESLRKGGGRNRAAGGRGIITKSAHLAGSELEDPGIHDSGGFVGGKFNRA